MTRVLIKTITIFMFIFLIFNCNKNNPNEDVELQELKSWMTGSFSSLEQSEADTNFFDIHLEMVQIWKDRKDGFWLYVEQAAAWSLEKPYRQRVYHLFKNADGSFESGVFSMKNPLRFAGVWKKEYPLIQLTPDSLAERAGCAIRFEFKNGTFVGGTVDKNCASQLHGASYATSEVRIEEKMLTSWDRGFDINDSQIWGAVTGPYIFKKLKDYN